MVVFVKFFEVGVTEILTQTQLIYLYLDSLKFEMEVE